VARRPRPTRAIPARNDTRIFKRLLGVLVFAYRALADNIARLLARFGKWSRPRPACSAPQNHSDGLCSAQAEK